MSDPSQPTNNPPLLPAVDESPTRGSRWEAVLLVDFLLGLFLVFDRYSLPGIPVPLGVPLIVVAAVVAFTRKPTLRVRVLPAVIVAYLVMVAWAVAVSYLNAIDWHQRALRLCLLLVFMVCFARGRLHIESWLWGVVCGLLINAGAFYAGLTNNFYPPHLTGFLGDKNVAGLWYALFLVVGLQLYRTKRGLIFHLVTFALLTFLTGSRTSMSAALAGLIWLGLRNRLGWVWRLGLSGLLIWLLGVVERNFARRGLFSDRNNTDWFRHQIDTATAAKLADSPWYGNGLTTAWVQLSAYRSIWFHDSYAALRVEGGWVMVAVMLALVVVVAGGVLHRGRVSREVAIMEGGLVVALVSAWKLGEVFFTTPLFLCLGIMVAWRYGRPLVAAAAPLASFEAAKRKLSATDADGARNQSFDAPVLAPAGPPRSAVGLGSQHQTSPHAS